MLRWVAIGAVLGFGLTVLLLSVRPPSAAPPEPPASVRAGIEAREQPRDPVLRTRGPITQGNRFAPGGLGAVVVAGPDAGAPAAAPGQ